MSKIICHIIGMDEINKKKLINDLIENVKIIDLDVMQMATYNHPELMSQKKKWEEISSDIIIKQRQKNLTGSKTNTQIKKLMTNRNLIRQNIHSLWKNKISGMIDNELSFVNNQYIIFVGFNIFPKDYRVKINLPIDSDGSEIHKKIIFNIPSTLYAENQIQYYINTQSARIIKGKFPLNLLKPEYLKNKYDKFTSFYEKQGYLPVDINDLIAHIQKLIVSIPLNSTNSLFSNPTIRLNSSSQLDGSSDNVSSGSVQLVEDLDKKITDSSVQLLKDKNLRESTVQLINAPVNKYKIDNLVKPTAISITNIDTLSKSEKNVFVATMFKCGDVIPVNSRTPLEGFYTREAAIKNMKTRIKKITQIYLYEIRAEQFSKINGKLIATQSLYPTNEDSYLLTI